MVIRLFYEEQAFLAQPEDPHIFLALIMTLNNVSFELDFNERSLDQQQDGKVVNYPLKCMLLVSLCCMVLLVVQKNTI